MLIIAFLGVNVVFYSEELDKNYTFLLNLCLVVNASSKKKSDIVLIDYYINLLFFLCINCFYTTKNIPSNKQNKDILH